jgi:hypothetical protein
MKIIRLFKSNLEKLKERISNENLSLLDEEARRSENDLQKLYDWQEDYDCVDWKEFRDEWIICRRCNGYNPGQCICYAR